MHPLSLFVLLAGCGTPALDGDTASVKGRYSPGSCGNGKCSTKESCETCPSDCGVCSEPPGPISVAWDAPTTNADGSALTDLEGYRVYYGTRSPVTASNGTKLELGNTTSTEIDGLSVGTVYVTVAAYDGSGNESALASQLAVDVR